MKLLLFTMPDGRIESPDRDICKGCAEGSRKCTVAVPAKSPIPLLQACCTPLVQYSTLRNHGLGKVYLRNGWRTCVFIHRNAKELVSIFSVSCCAEGSRKLIAAVRVKKAKKQTRGSKPCFRRSFRGRVGESGCSA